MTRYKPLVLIILDGWGYRHEASADNAIAAAATPTWDALWQNAIHTTIAGSGCAVGLPRDQMGNSEVGHLTMGAGRLIEQDLTRIDGAIAGGKHGNFFNNPVLLTTFAELKAKPAALHLIILLSPGGVHSHESHLWAFLKLAAAQGFHDVYLHLILDGRDTPPKSAAESIRQLSAVCAAEKCGKVISIIGRYYAMDRDSRWNRTQLAYELFTGHTASYEAPDALAGLDAAYARGETDEFVQATRIAAAQPIQAGDAVFFMNFRADRARQLTQAFIDTNFDAFQRQLLSLSAFVSMTQYDVTYQNQVVFPPITTKNGLGELLSLQHLPQIRLAETEKYAHVTFFFNGGIEAPYPLEERKLIPSPKVATYDLQPEMSADALTTAICDAICAEQHAMIICNFANPDMVGHTGNFAATVKAIETIDACLTRITAALALVDGECIITADHGNAEQLFDPTTNQPHTAHTTNPIPFIYLGRQATLTSLNGSLADIAPTILHLLDLPQPTEMTGNSLLKLV